jgi:hypothetical protein
MGKANRTRWFYLSFVGDEGFRGGCVVQAANNIDAVTVATELGINPGGDAFMVPCPDNEPGRLPVNRLLSKEELDGPGKTLGELEDQGLVNPDAAELIE